MKVITMITVGLALVLTSSCKQDKVDKTILAAELKRAQHLVKTPQEGVAVEDYLKGPRAALEVAVIAAQTVVNDPAATLATVAAATESLFAAVTTYQNQINLSIDSNNLVGYWTFNEIKTAVADNPVIDHSGKGHHGMIKAGHVFWGAGTPSLAADRYGIADKALHFDAGGNVEIPYSNELNPPVMTLAVWAKPDINSPVVNNQYIISMDHWHGYKFQFQDIPRAYFTATYDDPSADQPVRNHCCYDRDQDTGIAPQGTWHHYAVTFGGGHEVFYIDGILINDWNNTPGTISQLPIAVNLVFGQDLPTSAYVTGPPSNPNYVNYGGFFIGALDEVRIYKSVLTPAQVADIYNLEKP